MRKTGLSVLLVVFLLLMGCGNQQATNQEVQKSDNNYSKEAAANEGNNLKSETRTITYLNEDYIVLNSTERIVAASQEAMEDAAVLGIKPIGAIATGGEFPAYLGNSMSEAVAIGDKQQPNNETLLQLKPDVILGTSKFQPEVVKNLNSIATMIPISHISSNWKENLLVLAELTNKTAEAEKIINDYEANKNLLREQLAKSMADKEVLMVRLRGGNIYIYSPDFYFNPVLYSDLEFKIPEEVTVAKSQEMISLEKLAEMDPDFLFVQFEETENVENPQALKELQENAIWKSINAVKNEKVLINSVPPLAAGGTAWSKTEFLNVVKEKLAN